MTDADALAADTSDHQTELSPSTYDPAPASASDLAYAERLLAHQGMIPLTDAAGHRAAVRLWRETAGTRRGGRFKSSRLPLTRFLPPPGQR